MADSVRRGRGVARVSVEALEGRIVLSGAYGRQVSSTGLSLHAELDRYHASPESGTVNLTVSRSSTDAGRPIVFKVSTNGIVHSMIQTRVPKGVGMRLNRWPVGPESGVASGETDERLVMRSIRTTGRPTSSLPITPIDGTYRLKPGQASVTIPVRLNPRFSPPGDIMLDVRVMAPRPSHGTYFMVETLEIAPSPDRMPPEIVSTSLATGAITLTFSKPMDPATVEEVDNYVITGEAPDPCVPAQPCVVSPRVEVPVSLESAAYEPATRTVTLTPTGPLDPALFYHLRTPARGFTPVDPIPRLDAAKPLTDLQGNPLRGDMLSYGLTPLFWN